MPAPKLFDYEQMIKRIEKAQGNKQIWESHLRECYRYAMPERQTIDEFSKGQKKREYVFDSTAIEAVEDFASRMESQIVPPWKTWLMLEPGSEVPEDKIQEVEEYLEDATDVIFEHINHSNFNSQIHETFLDLAISTGCIICEEGDGIQSALNFRSVSLSEVILERSSRGIAETVWRDMKIAAADIINTWPNAELSDKLKQKAKDNPAEDITFIEGVAKDENTGKYVNMVIYPEDKDVIYEANMETSPWIVFRESTIPGEVYGRGRVMRALPDIKTLNKMVEDHLRSAAFTANPIFTATDDGIINPYTIRLHPGAVIPVGSNDNANPTLRPLQSGDRYDVLQYDIAKLQDTIKKALLSKPFGNIEETPVRTATEMSIRNADLQSSAGSASGRIQTELLERLINRIAAILIEGGKLVPFKVDGKEVTIKFTSPMARQQDTDDVMVLMQGMEILGGLPPEVVQREVKIEETPGYIIDKMGLPKKFKRSDLEKQEFDKKMQEQMMAMQGAQGGAE